MTLSSKRSIKQKNSSLPVISGSIIILIILMGIGWFFFTPNPQPPVTIETPQIEPTAQPTQPTEAKEPDSEPQINQPTQKVKEKSECEQASEEIRNFFNYLDRQDYIDHVKLKGGSHAHFSRLIDKLIANPPIIFQETESLFSILNNTAHFYRTLRKDDVFLIKEILNKEGNSIESIMALFYRWSLPGVYEYAGFFINTLGGQSYLFRRESRVRMLIKYYSVLVLDRANEKSINRFGIDIRPSIESLLSEMQGTANLKGKDDYLAKLLILQDKYTQQYGEDKVEMPESK